MSIGDTARKSYDAARSELVERIRLRDQVLLIYLGVVGTIFGIALGTIDKKEILLTIPFISLGCSILVSQHNFVIGTLLKFISKEIKPLLLSLSPPEYASFFGCSKAFKDHCRRSNIFRSSGHGIIILVPNFVALALNLDHAIKPPIQIATLWWFGLFFMIFALCIILYAHKLRSKVYKETLWDE